MRSSLCGLVVSLSIAAGGSLSVANCIGNAPRTLSKHEKIELCADALSDGPSQCAKRMSFSARKGVDLSMALCVSATSEAPALCFKASSKLRNFDGAARVSLCRGATSDIPVQCSSTVSRLNPSVELQIALCKETSSLGPALCFKNAKSLIDEEKLSLCKGSTSIAPAQCAVSQLLRRTSPRARIELCKGAQQDWSKSAECMKAVPSQFSDMHKVALCKGSMSTDPARCAEALKFSRLDNSLKVELCLGGPGATTAAGAASMSPVECFKKAPAHLTPEFKVMLCRGSTSVAPAECALMLKGSHWRKPDGVRAAVDMCANSYSTAPALCGKPNRVTVQCAHRC
jgi:hypothetical protein